MNARRLVAAALAVATLTLTLTACDAIPDSGPVREGLTQLDQVERGVQFTPAGPQVGADQEAIVRGFVRAASSSMNDYEVAREYLAPMYSDQWDPSYSVLVDEGTHQYEITEGNVATLSLSLVANVDEAGTLTLAQPNQQTDLQFELTQVQGEWRISSAPSGIILDRNTFTAVWAPRALYYVGGDGRMVPDVRWFLSRTSMLSTQIVRELLRGPSQQMQSALRTSFPEGTSLASESVPVIDGTALIDVTAELIDADAATLNWATRQVSLSLPSTIARFQLSVHGAVVAEGEVTSPSDTPPAESPFIAVARDGDFGTLSGGEIEPLAGLSERIDELSPTAVSLSPDHNSAVVLSPGGASWVHEQDIVVVDTRDNLLAPGLDVLGYVWTYATDERGHIEVSKPGGDEARLSTPWLESRQAVAVRVSIGGNYLAALVKTESGSAVLVAGIVRDENGQPIALTEEITTQLWTTGSPIDLDWIGDTRFAVLTESGLLGASARVTLGYVGNFATEAGMVPGGDTVSGGSRALLRVLDSDGVLYAPQGLASWQQYQRDIDLLAKVG